jgi:hypothetical protein
LNVSANVNYGYEKIISDFKIPRKLVYRHDVRNNPMILEFWNRSSPKLDVISKAFADIRPEPQTAAQPFATQSQKSSIQTGGYAIIGLVAVVVCQPGVRNGTPKDQKIKIESAQSEIDQDKTKKTAHS